MSIMLFVQKKGSPEPDGYPIFSHGEYKRIIEPAAENLGLEEVLHLDDFVTSSEPYRTKLVDELTVLLKWIEDFAPENERQHLLLRTSRLQSLIRDLDLSEYEISIG